MNLEAITEKFMKMDDETWERHVNPLSGWTRIATMPLITIAIWSRVWLGWWALSPLLACLIWLWQNPRAFAKPQSTNNWMSESILGEKIWLQRGTKPIPRTHRAVPQALNLGGAGALLVYAIGLYQLDVALTACGLLLLIIFKLWFLDRMVWLLRDFEDRK